MHMIVCSEERGCLLMLAASGVAGSSSAGLVLEPLSPLGAIVRGIDFGRGRPSPAIIAALEKEAAVRGFLVFPNASLPGDMLLKVSGYFGSGVLAARHTVHDTAVHEDILRVSNDEAHGIFGVGPQWHHDGSFERRLFSHVLFHAQRMPSRGGGGGTQFTDLAAVYDALPRRLQHEWSRLATVNAYSGAVHPLVIRHPQTGRRSLCIHLGMVGAVVRWRPHADAAATATVAAAAEEEEEEEKEEEEEEGITDARRSSAAVPLPESGCPVSSSSMASFRRLEAMDPTAGPDFRCGHELLGAAEVHELLRSINERLSSPAHSATWSYSARQTSTTSTGTSTSAAEGEGEGGEGDGEGAAGDGEGGEGGEGEDGEDGEDGTTSPACGAGVLGDLILVDNLAAAHRATPEAHDRSGELRILHRTTVQGSWAADPPPESRLPPFAYIWGQEPLAGRGLWQPADRYGVGVRWNASLPMRN